MGGRIGGRKKGKQVEGEVNKNAALSWGWRCCWTCGRICCNRSHLSNLWLLKYNVGNHHTQSTNSRHRDSFLWFVSKQATLHKWFINCISLGEEWFRNLSLVQRGGSKLPKSTQTNSLDGCIVCMGQNAVDYGINSPTISNYWVCVMILTYAVYYVASIELEIPTP